jgi:SOS-response transcriptional repressor LexA
MLKDILDRIHKRLEATGLPAATASAKAGLSKDAIRNIERAVEQGKEAGASTQTILKLAPVLGTTAGWLIEGIGREEEVEIPIMGFLGAGAEIMPEYEQVPPEGLDHVTLPFPIPSDMIAFEVRGDSMLPAYKSGHVIIVYRDQKRNIEAFYGEEAAVRTSDGRRYIKTIMRGSKGRVNLLSWNAAPIEDVKLEWIGEIFAVLPRSQLKHIERQGGIQGRLSLGA